MKIQFTEEAIKVMQTALDVWGLNAQVGQTVEECAELIVALQKYVNRTPRPETVDNILDEIADVEMMLAQMRLILGIDDDTLRKRIEYKFEKLSQYLSEDENDKGIQIQKFAKHAENLESEAVAIANLADEIWREHYKPIIGTEQVDYMLAKFQSAEQICEDIKHNGYIYFTAVHINSGEMIGYCASQPKENYLLLSKLYVRKDYRGKGVARRFLDEIIVLCRVEYGFDKIRLTVNKYNDNSIAAYQKMGFETIDSVRTDIGNRFFMDDFVLEL